MMKKNPLFKFFLIFTLSSCGNNNNDNQNEQTKFVDTVVSKMQANIDSTATLSDYALQDHKHGVSTQEILLKYGASINQLEKVSVEVFQEATVKYKQGTLSQESYDRIRAKVFTDSVQAKLGRLNSLGINFESIK